MRRLHRPPPLDIGTLATLRIALTALTALLFVLAGCWRPHVIGHKLIVRPVPAQAIIGRAPPTTERTQRLLRHLASICEAHVVSADGVSCRGPLLCEEQPSPYSTLANDLRTRDVCWHELDVTARYGDVKGVQLLWGDGTCATCVQLTSASVEVNDVRNDKRQRYCHNDVHDRETIEMAWRLLAEIADAPFDVVEQCGPTSRAN